MRRESTPKPGLRYHGKAMAEAKTPRIANVLLSKLRPTQLTVGMLEVKRKRKRLRALERRPSELVEFILENPVRVVLGPAANVYVIDHHHLALALILERFETAPMEIEADFSTLGLRAFWKKMDARQFVHPVDASGRRMAISALPTNLKHLEDDPYRSLAGFTREAGAWVKVPVPFAEFQWADFFRTRIDKKLVRKHFQRALICAIELASSKEAAGLPGYVVLKAK
jgi:hypothetical protein